MSLVKLEITKGVAQLTLNDPERLNAMSLSMAEDFRARLEELKGREGLRAVVLRGAGRAFSAGGDLDMLLAKRELSWADNRTKMLEFYRSFLGIIELPVPVIAALHGHAVGAGFCLAAACDLRVGDQSCKLAAPFTRLGLHPGMGATYFLPRLLGSARAAEWMLRGSRYVAQEALDAGFLNYLVEVGELDNKLEKLTSEILSGGPAAVAALLQTLRPDGEALHSALVREAEAQADSYASAEFVEGVLSVKEKRPPAWI